MKRLSDQVLILTSISEVRKELENAENNIQRTEVSVRLMTLYALLDINALKIIVKQTDSRRYHNKEAA